MYHCTSALSWWGKKTWFSAPAVGSIIHQIVKSTCILNLDWIRLNHSCCCLSRPDMLLHGSKPYKDWDSGSSAQPTDIYASEQTVPKTHTCFIGNNYHSQVYESLTIRQDCFNSFRYPVCPIITYSKYTTKTLKTTNRYSFELRASMKGKANVVFLWNE